MIYQTNSTALEQPSTIAQLLSVESTICVSCLLSYAKTIAQKIDVLLPASFIDEIEDFARRNSITEANSCCISCRTQVNQACPSCIKAHAMKKAKEMKLNPRIINFLSGLIEQEKGHNGYYLDGSKLIKYN